MPIREQQTTNKQHAIPQSIMSVEFKIIGDLTLKQFFYLMGFAIPAYMSFVSVQAGVLKWLLILVFSLSGLGFAFIPLGDRSLDVWVINFFRAVFFSNQYVYRKQEEVPNVFLYQNLDVLKNELITLTPTTSRRKIEAFLEQQKVPEDKLDIDERKYILMVKNAYREGYGQTPTQITVEVEETPAPPMQELPAPQAPQDLTRIELPAPHSPEETSENTAEKAAVIEQPKQQTQPQKETPIIRSQASFKRYHHKKRPEPQENNYYSPTMTPDMHAGRRFINLAAEAGRGDIILPIRGERVLQTEEEKKFDIDEAEKVKQLDTLIHEITNKEVIQKQISEAKRIDLGEETRKKHLEAETLRVKKEELINMAEQERLEKERLQAQAKIQEPTNVAPTQPKTDTTPPTNSKEDSPPTPNIVWGTVVTTWKNDKVPVPGVVVIIRDQRKEVVRAVKTSSRGRFGITTPLINGSYNIEIDKENKSGLIFGVTALEATGEIIPTIEIVGKA